MFKFLSTKTDFSGYILNEVAVSTVGISFHYCVVDYRFVFACDICATELNLKCGTAGTSMAACDEFTDYYSELNDIEQENVGTETVDEDSLRTPDGLSVVV